MAMTLFVKGLTLTNLEGVVVTLKATTGEGDLSSGWGGFLREEDGGMTNLKGLLGETDHPPFLNSY
jgi:hypothetical protein